LRTIFDPALVILACGVAAASVIDIRTRRIPNVLTGAMAAGGLVLAAVGAGSVTPAAAVGGLVVGALLMLPGHAIGATGAGDVKLMAAVGALLGPAAVVSAFVATAIAGGLLAVIVAMQRRRLAATIATTGRLVAAPVETKRAIEAPARANRFAYGPAIAVGSLIAVLMR
jgi:prepilin peptidase CpaA